jgi:UDP-N-acetylmuramoylalanine--D-glutamate ligase
VYVRAQYRRRNMEFQNVKTLVIGSGISGIGAVSLLARFGADIILYDSSDKVTAEELQDKLEQGLAGQGVESPVYCIAGELPTEVEEQVETVVLSPGVPTDIPLVNRLRERGVPILGEIELGFLAEQGRVAAITGTNGKTTTTTLVGEIMKAHLGADRVFVVGNIGNPYTLEVPKTRPDTVTVGEISSFQLETVHSFRPKVSAILNITPDHLNRHHTMEAYVAAKEAITCNQNQEDICVLNAENAYTAAFAERCPARVVLFSSRRELKNGYYLKGDAIVKSVDGHEETLLDIHRDMNLVGICNVENVMAAIAIAEGMQVPMETILKVIKEFHAVEHRIEFVATKNGVDYYNDSKGTNPDAAIQGIRAMSKPTVLIGGGYDKESEYDEWIESFEGKVTWLVLIGQTREKIAECAKKHGFASDRIRFADTYEECLKLCSSLAEEGDAVLLSPACASWGMFPNYEVRGQQFKEYVNAL